LHLKPYCSLASISFASRCLSNLVSISSDETCSENTHKLSVQHKEFLNVRSDGKHTNYPSLQENYVRLPSNGTVNSILERPEWSIKWRVCNFWDYTLPITVSNIMLIHWNVPWRGMNQVANFFSQEPWMYVR